MISPDNFKIFNFRFTKHFTFTGGMVQEGIEQAKLNQYLKNFPYFNLDQLKTCCPDNMGDC